jgi:AsmA protein
MDIGEFQEAAGAEELLFGNLNINIDISFSSFKWSEALKSMKGEVEVNGTNLLMQGMDIDKMLDIYESTRQFKASDLGAVFIAGPYGAVFAQGINYAVLLTEKEEQTTEIRKFVSNWSIMEGIASAKDVAFSTNKYRMALSGKLNFNNSTYHNMVIAMINKDGCAALSEEMNGSFLEPEKESFSNLARMRVPSSEIWMELAKSSRRICEPVYTGSVDHPSVD